MSARLETKYVEANGLRFAYLEEGSGPLMFLWHGFPDTAHTWDRIRPKIAERGYRVVTPWLRGYFPTAAPAEDATTKMVGQDVLALIDALGDGEPAIVLGHDWGAGAAYSAAAQGPEKISRLFAVAIPHPAALKPTLKVAWGARHFLTYKAPWATQAFARRDFAALPKLYKRWSPTWSPGPEEFDDIRACYSHPESLDAAFGYYRAWRPGLQDFMKPKLPMPTVVFAGTDDPILDLSFYEAARRRFTGDYTVEPLPGGHFPHRESPERFEELLFKHLPAVG